MAAGRALATFGRRRPLTVALRRAARAPGNSARFRITLMSSSSSLSALYVRDGRGRYQRAEADQILQAARRLVDQRLQRGVTLSDPSVAKEFLRLRMATLEHEGFAATLLDTRHRVLEYSELFRATIVSAPVHPRDTAKPALA